ncbi:MAG: hypothetical protein HQM12_14520 [SAR324 cluster bacterium]|nr:hypothetical protein [SAR324 cluster bacterium]
MISIINVLLFAGAGLLAVSLYQLKLRQSRQMEALFSDIRELQQSLKMELSPSESNGSRKPGVFLSIKIRDPLGVARKESKLAPLVADIAPGIVTREVYKQVRKESLQMLAQRGVEADVDIVIQ